MLKLYKNWFLDADPYQYIVGRVKERERDGKAVVEMVNPSYHPTIVAAVSHVLESEMRAKVKSGELLNLAEAMAFYSTVADDLLAEIESVPGNLKRAVQKHGAE